MLLAALSEPLKSIKYPIQVLDNDPHNQLAKESLQWAIKASANNNQKGLESPILAVLMEQKKQTQDLNYKENNSEKTQKSLDDLFNFEKKHVRFRFR